MTLTLGSLFDGIGGFPLAAIRQGITPLWASEIEPFPIQVTKHHFPETLHMGDITRLDGAKLPPVDIICGGSPCQDLSVASCTSEACLTASAAFRWPPYGRGSPHCGPARLSPSPFKSRNIISRRRSIWGISPGWTGRSCRRWTLSAAAHPVRTYPWHPVPAPDWPAHGPGCSWSRSG